jgi:prepilin-type N-terminal cleavage/methylation domain-containing protein
MRTFSGPLPGRSAIRRVARALSRTHRQPPAPLASPGAQDGFTLIEVLVSSVVALVVFGAILGVLESSQRVEARDTEWALTMQEGRAGLARMAREIRQASTTPAKAEASLILFSATIGGTEWTIKYACNVTQTGTAFDQCVRYAAKKGEALPSTGAPIVSDVINGTAVFKYFKQSSENATAPDYVTLKIELPANGTLKQAGSSGYSHNVVLEDAAFMRNLDLEG